MSKEILEQIYNVCDNLDKDQIITLIKQGVIENLTQPTTLDSDVEEALGDIGGIEILLKGATINQAKSFNKSLNTIKAHIQAQQSKLDKVREIVIETFRGQHNMDVVMYGRYWLELQKLLKEETE